MSRSRKDTCQPPRTAESFDPRTSEARVVEWQTRTFEGRMPKGMRVQVPPRARIPIRIAPGANATTFTFRLFRTNNLRYVAVMEPFVLIAFVVVAIVSFILVIVFLKFF